MPERAKSDSVGPLLVLIVGAVCISFSPIFVKLIGEERLGPTAIGFWRTLFGGLALFIASALLRKRLVLSRRLFGFAALAGFIFFLDLFAWHRSIIYCGAGMSTILANTQIFCTAVLSFFIFKERLSLRFLAAAVSAMVGVVLLIGTATGEVVFTTRYVWGIVLGLATAIVYAHYLITIRWSGFREAAPDIVVFMAWVSLFSALFLGLAAAVESAAMMPPDMDSLRYLLALGLVVQAMGWWTISSSLAKIAASRAGLVLLLQPTLAMIWGVVMFSEQFTFSQAVGAVVTLAAIYYGGLRGRQ